MRSKERQGTSLQQPRPRATGRSGLAGHTCLHHLSPAPLMRRLREGTGTRTCGACAACCRGRRRALRAPAPALAGPARWPVAGIDAPVLAAYPPRPPCAPCSTNRKKLLLSSAMSASTPRCRTGSKSIMFAQCRRASQEPAEPESHDCRAGVRDRPMIDDEVAAGRQPTSLLSSRRPQAAPFGRQRAKALED